MEPITVVIETPKGSAEKFDYVPEQKAFKLHKVMPAGMVFPHDFGFIPDTKGEDGDPLDVMVLSAFKTFPGCLVDCRIIGAIAASQVEKNGDKMRNDRFLAIPTVSHEYDGINEVSDLPTKLLEELEHFFKAYNEVSGKVFEPLERMDAGQAIEMIEINRASQQ